MRFFSPSLIRTGIALCALSATLAGFVHADPLPGLNSDAEARSRDCGRRNREKTPLVIVADATNFDDTMALILMSKAENYELKGVYIVGNAWAEPGVGARNTFNIIDWFGHTDAPVVIGSFYPLLERSLASFTLDGVVPPPPPGEDPFLDPFYSSSQNYTSTVRASIPMNDGGLPYTSTIWGTSHLLPQSRRHYVAKNTATPDTWDDQVSVSITRNIIRNSDRPVTILSLGSKTGLFDVLDDATLDTGKVDHIMMMGGAFGNGNGNLFNLNSTPFYPFSGDLNPYAEFNIYNDPIAADEVFVRLANHNIQVTIVPLDATNTLPLTHAFLDRMRAEAKTPEAKYASIAIDQVARTWFDPVGLFTLYIWDAAAALALLDRSIVASEITGTGVRVNRDVWTNINFNTTEPAVSPPGPSLGDGFIEVTNLMSYHLGQTVASPVYGNNVTIITGFNLQATEDLLIRTLNSKRNSALADLKEPRGLYKYRKLCFPIRNPESPSMPAVIPTTTQEPRPYDPCETIIAQ